jgi:methylase of polypeptide subunit release factors
VRPLADPIATLRPALQAAGYTLPAVQQLLGADRHLSSREEDLVIFERRFAGDAALPLAGRLFLLNREVDRAAWDRALPSLPAAGLEEMGLASSAGGVLRATVRLVPHGDIYIASDALGEDRTAEHVTGINNPAVLLSELAVRRSVKLGLDLGCGGGIQSLLMSRHCERVIATDLNPRALEFTQLNARINGVSNVETRLGSLFEPVEGLAFDLILCNPPYVISPESQFLYRDSGMPADSLCRQLVGEAGLHLADGGFAQFLVSWAQPADRQWRQVLEGWLGAAPCDAWFLHYNTEDPLTYASKWNRPLRFSELAGYGAVVDRWTAYCREQSIDAIGFGSVTLRRRSGAINWRRADELHEGHNTASDHIQRVFVAEDLLRALPDEEALFLTRCRLAPGHRLEQTMVEGPEGGWQPLETRLVMTQGLGFQGSLDLPLAQVLQHLDGRRTLAEATAAAAAEMGIGANELPDFRQAAAATVRRLFELGFLEPE